MISNREELTHALREAAELEHGLLLQYLFAAFSFKRRIDEGLTSLDQSLIGDWERTILRVAVEEMAHLGTVCNLLSAIGAAPHFRRPNFPQPIQRYYPFDFQLERFGDAALYRFLCFELPVGEPPPPRHLGAAPADVAPAPLVYSRVGELYGQIKKAITTLPNLFIGPQEQQDKDDWGNAMKLLLVKDAATAAQAIDSIVMEGEGTAANRDNSHYGRFLAIRKALGERPGFDPARRVATNPLTLPHDDAGAGVSWITHASSRRVAELFSYVYQTMLLMLAQFYSYGGESTEQRALLQAASRQTMSAVLRPLAEQLTQMPLDDPGSPMRAGPAFEMFTDIALSPALANRLVILDERFATAADECDVLAAAAAGEADPLFRLRTIAESLRLLRVNLTATQA